MDLPPVPDVELEKPKADCTDIQEGSDTVADQEHKLVVTTLKLPNPPPAAMLPELGDTEYVHGGGALTVRTNREYA
jgi:hypothetical protein